jgi:hypothetical protein
MCGTARPDCRRPRNIHVRFAVRYRTKKQRKTPMLQHICQINKAKIKQFRAVQNNVLKIAGRRPMQFSGFGVRAQFSARSDGGVTVLSLGGVVTLDVFEEVHLARAFPGASHAVCHAFVVRLDDAVLLCKARSMAATLRSRQRLGLLRLPAALVGRPEQAAMLQKHCTLAAEHGVVRAVFTTEQGALAWAFSKAQSARLSALSAPPLPTRPHSPAPHRAGGAEFHPAPSRSAEPRRTLRSTGGASGAGRRA